MAANSAIEWTTHTFNPWWGCTKVAAGCTNCYAASLSKRVGEDIWGADKPRKLTSEKNWAEPLKWNRDAEKAGQRVRVFCASMADVFEDWDGPFIDHKGRRVYRTANSGWITLEPKEEASIATIAQTDPLIAKWTPATMADARRRLFDLIDATPWLDWLLVTKRPENIRRFWPMNYGCPADQAIWHRPNVWLLTSVAEQKDADANVPELLKCRDLAPVLGLSCEPLIEAVDLTPWLSRSRNHHVKLNIAGALRNRSFDGFNDDAGRPMSRSAVESKLRELDAQGVKFMPLGDCNGFDPQVGCPGHPNPSIDWVIAGGDSGPGARPMHPDWARGLRDQCAAAGVAFFFKQWGEYSPEELIDDRTFHRYRDRYTDGTCSPELMRYFDAKGELLRAGDGCCEEGMTTMVRVGKKAAGRLLDGVTHDAMPLKTWAVIYLGSDLLGSPKTNRP